MRMEMGTESEVKNAGRSSQSNSLDIPAHSAPSQQVCKEPKTGNLDPAIVQVTKSLSVLSEMHIRLEQFNSQPIDANARPDLDSNFYGHTPKVSFNGRLPNLQMQRGELTVPVAFPREFSSWHDVPGSEPLSLPHLSLSEERATPLPVIHMADNLQAGSRSFQRRFSNACTFTTKLSVGMVFTRSFSLPMQKTTSLRKMSSPSSGVILVRPAIGCIPVVDVIGNSKKSTFASAAEEEHCKEIPEEDAICRICMDTLSEGGGETLKMDCSCKGGLALAHEKCAVKWFGIRGNRICDICGQEVQNLPVTLIRLLSASNHQAEMAPQMEAHRVWEDMSVVSMISMFAYFCFIEQLLLSDMGYRAFLIALPLSCLLGVLGCACASIAVSRRNIWIYSTIQFGLVVLLSHLFYVLLHAQALLAVLLGSLLGFFLALNSIALGSLYVYWKNRSAGHQNLTSSRQEGQFVRVTLRRFSVS